MFETRNLNVTIHINVKQHVHRDFHSFISHVRINCYTLSCVLDNHRVYFNLHPCIHQNLKTSTLQAT